jgi:hypothetical protein
MSVVEARVSAIAAHLVNLCSAQAGTGDTTNTADRGCSSKANSTKLRVTAIAGATPTCTYSIQVSSDGVNFSAATYADVSTPSTDVATTFVLTGGVAEKIVKNATGWRYIKVTMSANTNITNTIDVIYNDAKRWV